MKAYRTEYEKWVNSSALSPAQREELNKISEDEYEIESRFFAPLAFGTAGLRGIMGIGLCRMNDYVVRHATQGFARIIIAEGKKAMERGIIICYDCRVNSVAFARQAACVMAANGIKVKLFDDMRPTPELSFAIRHYGAIGGINVTASHNPKEYNGYKVYWSDGAQLPPAHAEAVAQSMAETDIFTGVKCADFDKAVSDGMITLIGGETDEEFLINVMEQSVSRSAVKQVAEEFGVVYTPFHGTGAKLVPQALRQLGIKHIYPVAEQMIPDGTFPTVVSPNPENPEGFALAIELARKNGADIIIGTDPDADRVGAMAKTNGEYSLISGNQMGVLLLNYLIETKKAAGTLPENAAALKTIVTTEMARAVAEKSGVSMYDTFTGFKFMAEKMKALEGQKQVILSFEESYGYMIGGFLRDKDAITASMLIAEMSAWYKSRDMTLFDGLNELYSIHGHYMERTLNLVMPGLDGLRRMEKLMENLRSNAPESIGGLKVSKTRDYLTGDEIDKDGMKKMELSGSNVIGFTLSDGTNFLIRPSGTEPKVKVYILARGDSAEQCSATIDKCARFADGLKD